MLRRSKGMAQLRNHNGSDSECSTQGLPVRQQSIIDITEGIRELILDDGDTAPGMMSPVEAAFSFKSDSVAERLWNGSTQSETSTTLATTPVSSSIDATFPSKNQSMEKPVEGNNGDPTPMARPRLKHKSKTAPGAVTDLLSVVPEPPRRAVSTRTTRLLPMHDTRSTPSSPANSVLPRASKLASTPTSRSIISRHKVNRHSYGRHGFKLKRNVWHTTLGPNLKRYEKGHERLSEAIGNRQHNSFSDRNHVQETLKNEKVEFLKTDIMDVKDGDLPGTPFSLVSTPRELYRIPNQGRDPLREQGKLKIPKPPSKAGRRLSLSLTSAPRRVETVIRRTSFLSPDMVPHTQPVYVPGPITIDSYIPGMRRDSVASLEPFIGQVEKCGHGRRLSDDLAMDSVVAYFLDFGVVDFASEDCIDRFWEVGDIVDSNTSGTRTLGAGYRPTSISPVPVPPHMPSPEYSPPVAPGRPLVQEGAKRIPPAQQQKQRVTFRRLLQSASTII